MDFTLKVVGGDISSVPGLSSAIEVGATPVSGSYPPSFIAALFFDSFLWKFSFDCSKCKCSVSKPVGEFF